MSRALRSEGFALVAAIFVIVVMASAGTLMVTLFGVSQRTSLFSLQGDRAYYAARSGVEWGASRALTLAACPASPTTLSLTDGGLVGFEIAVTCTSSSHTEAGATLEVYQLVSVATYSTFGSLDYVQRRVSGTITDAP